MVMLSSGEEGRCLQHPQTQRVGAGARLGRARGNALLIEQRGTAPGGGAMRQAVARHSRRRCWRPAACGGRARAHRCDGGATHGLHGVVTRFRRRLGKARGGARRHNEQQRGVAGWRWWFPRTRRAWSRRARGLARRRRPRSEGARRGEDGVAAADLGTQRSCAAAAGPLIGAS